jgi:hypothetical protein
MLNLWRNIVGKAIDFCVGKLIAPYAFSRSRFASTNPPLRMIRANRFDLLMGVAVL